MSEAAPERPRPVPDRTAGAPGGGNFLTRKAGPLPVWGWVTIGIVTIGGYVWYRNRRQTSAAASQQSTAGSAGGCTDTSGNTVPCGQDNAGDEATLQTEIMDLQQGLATDQGQSQIPDVIGQEQSLAFAAISAAGFKPTGSPVQPGRVLIVDAQDPTGGTTATKGTTVNLTSSVHGPGGGGQGAEVTVPKVTGDTQAVAFGKITAAGLKPKGSAVQRGKVLTVDSQSPAAGTRVQRGSTVTLVSRPKQTQPPVTQVKGHR